MMQELPWRVLPTSTLAKRSYELAEMREIVKSLNQKYTYIVVKECSIYRINSTLLPTAKTVNISFASCSHYKALSTSRHGNVTGVVRHGATRKRFTCLCAINRQFVRSLPSSHYGAAGEKQRWRDALNLRDARRHVPIIREKRLSATLDLTQVE